MATLRIYQDSRAVGTCRSCGAAIEWAELTTGARHPFELPIKPIRAQQSLVDGRTIEDVETRDSPTHFARCPDAKSWRRQPAGPSSPETSRRGGGVSNR